MVPVLVGSLKADQEQNYGKLFSKYLTDPQNLFIISSDFCHWGKILPGKREVDLEGAKVALHYKDYDYIRQMFKKCVPDYEGIEIQEPLDACLYYKHLTKRKVALL